MNDVCPELLSLFDLMIDVALKDMADAGALTVPANDTTECEKEAV